MNYNHSATVSKYNIYVCVLGAWALLMSVTAEDTLSHQTLGHTCGDKMDMIDGKPTGAIRISLGWCSTFDDISKFLAFVQEYFIEKCEKDGTTGSSWGYTSDRSATTSNLNHCSSPQEMGFLSKIYLYPVKSCRGQVVDNWPVTTSGLLCDRHWALVDGKGKLMTLRRYPEMVLIVARYLMQFLSTEHSCGVFIEACCFLPGCPSIQDN